MRKQSTATPRADRRNGPEQKFAQLAAEKGWFATKRGWPDFLCFNEDGEMIAVEVKPQMRSRPGVKVLRRDQANCMDVLTAHGIRCFVSDGETIEPYDPAVHNDESRRYSRHRLKQVP